MAARVLAERGWDKVGPHLRSAMPSPTVLFRSARLTPAMAGAMAAATASAIALVCAVGSARADKPHKPVLHGQHWVAITGKPLGAQAGAMIFQRGGNAVDATCGMLAAVTTLWDTLSWGGETQALIYDPTKKKVIGINAPGVAPTGGGRESV